MLNLAPQVLSGTVESLEHIDKVARHLQVDLDDPTILAPIVAYVGEVLRRATDGRWAIRGLELYGGDDMSQWEPVIVGANGHDYHTFVAFKELLEDGSIHAVISFELSGRHLC